MLENIPSQSTLSALLGQALRFGKSCVPRLTKNMKWNNYGIPAVRVGHTSISIREAAKRFVAYMQKVIASVS